LKLETFLETETDTRRIFGKREIEIIKKQLNGYPLTQSERNRISRDIKPKLEIIRKLEPFVREFSLKKNQNNTELIKEAKEVVMADPMHNHIKAMLVFGSLIDGTFHQQSDIDIGILFDNCNPKDATLFRKRVMAEISNKMDIQIINSLPKEIRKSIVNKNRVIFRQEGFSRQMIMDELYKEETTS